ncbi:MAG: hypothetical protein GX575_27870 [Candidatus Anammoximicrobium sp.]|nr:hypothetical protein [Candidatus Anammoximicrobium sp.]
MAELARSLKAAGHHADEVAPLLLRCFVTVFAEDVERLPREPFRNLLHSSDDVAHFLQLVEEL